MWNKVNVAVAKAAWNEKNDILLCAGCAMQWNGETFPLHAATSRQRNAQTVAVQVDDDETCITVTIAADRDAFVSGYQHRHYARHTLQTRGLSESKKAERAYEYPIAERVVSDRIEYTAIFHIVDM
jgi:hypothetical protein